MKVLLQQKENATEPELKITYAVMTERLMHLVEHIRQYSYSLECRKDQKQTLVRVEDVLYADCVDGKTFLYTKDTVYESQHTVLSLEKILEYTTVMRVGKGTLVNVSYVKSVQPYPNHRLIVELENEEKVVVSRKYKEKLKEKIRRMVYE